LSDRLTKLAEQVIPQRNKPTLPNRRKSLQKKKKTQLVRFQPIPCSEKQRKKKVMFGSPAFQKDS